MRRSEGRRLLAFRWDDWPNALPNNLQNISRMPGLSPSRRDEYALREFARADHLRFQVAGRGKGGELAGTGESFGECFYLVFLKRRL